MTLDEAVELANRVASESAHRISVDDAKRLARFLRDTLGQQMPCGFDEPRPSTTDDDDGCEHCDGSGSTIHYDGRCYTIDEAEAVGVAMIRAARFARAALQAKGGE
jgi:hypothetical protein